MYNAKENFSVLQRLVASSTGAIITSILVTPLDVVKIRLQAQSKPLSSGDCFIYCNGLMDHICQYVNGNNKSVFNIATCKKNIHFHNSFDAFQKIVKTEGMLSLWSGLSPTLVLAIPQVIIYYTLNDWLKHVMGYDSYKCRLPNQLSGKFLSNTFNKDDLIPPVSGAIARFVAQMTIAPLELVRTKMQSKKLTYAEITTIASSAIRQGGVTVLWRGLGPTMWRDVPYTVTLWFIYEYLKKRHLTKGNHYSQDGLLPYHLVFLYSAYGAIAAGIISHPFDVTKTHRQIELGNAVLYNKRMSSSTWGYLKMLKKTEGYSSIFSGFIPRIFRVVIATTTMITIFEATKIGFIKYYQSKDLKKCF